MRIFVETKPLPAPRPRFSKFGTYNKKEYTAYKRLIALQYRARKGKLHEGKVKIAIEFFFKIPPSWSKSKKQRAGEYLPRADVDNLAKGVLDALNGVAYKDDKQIQSLFVRKQYTSNRDAIMIEVYE